MSKSKPIQPSRASGDASASGSTDRQAEDSKPEDSKAKAENHKAEHQKAEHQKAEANKVGDREAGKREAQFVRTEPSALAFDEAGQREQAAQPQAAEQVTSALAACTGCGLCNVICPTYAVELDERDGPRGRIALMQLAAQADWSSRQADLDLARTHLERCTACGLCQSLCPEPVEFRRALNISRSQLLANDGTALRAQRKLADTLCAPEQKRRAIATAKVVSHLKASAGVFVPSLRNEDPEPTRAVGSHAVFRGPGVALTQAERRGRLLLVPSCLQRALRPSAADAALRLLARRGYDVEIPAGAGCCGDVAIQIGCATQAHEMRQATSSAIARAHQRAVEEDGFAPFDALLTTGEPCAGTLSDYQGQPGTAGLADASVAQLLANAMTIGQFLARFEFGAPERWSALRIGVLAYCSQEREIAQPGRDNEATQETTDDAAIRLLTEAGYCAELVAKDGCCGGRGAYPWICPNQAGALREEKLTSLREAAIDVLAVHDAGCAAMLNDALAYPVVHLVELIDWAYGGPAPDGLEPLSAFMWDVPRPPQPEDEAERNVGAD